MRAMYISTLSLLSFIKYKLKGLQVPQFNGGHMPDFIVAIIMIFRASTILCIILKTSTIHYINIVFVLVFFKI